MFATIAAFVITLAALAALGMGALGLLLGAVYLILPIDHEDRRFGQRMGVAMIGFGLIAVTIGYALLIRCVA